MASRPTATASLRRSSPRTSPRRTGLRKAEFVCLRCGYTEVRYFPTRRRPSGNVLYCQRCLGTPTGVGQILVAYWLEGFGSSPTNPLRDHPPGIAAPGRS